MKGGKVRFTSVDAYIASFPQAVQAPLEELRAAIKAAAPGAQEKISYHMPAFVLNGNLVHFAAWKNHIGFYGASKANPALNKELASFANEKGALKFPLDRPLPLGLIRRIVKLRVSENLKKPGKVLAGKTAGQRSNRAAKQSS